MSTKPSPACPGRTSITRGSNCCASSVSMALCVSASLVILHLLKINSPVQQFHHTCVHNSIVDINTGPFRSKDASVCQPLKLVGNCLWFHLQRRSQICDTHLPGPGKSINHSQPRAVPQHLEYRFQFCCTLLGQ